MSTENTKQELLNKAIAAVENYEAALNDTSFAGSIDEHICNLFGGWAFQDNTYEYQSICSAFLKLYLSRLSPLFYKKN